MLPNTIDVWCYRLLQQDTENLLIGRMVYNYQDTIAEVTAQFADGFSVTVYIDALKDVLYASFDGRIPGDAQEIFGFIPPLGPLSEKEEIIARVSYLKACMKTSLAPRHLRNHFLQILSREEFVLIQEIISVSWKNIELLDYEIDKFSNQINCYYKEDRMVREIAWAGQGLQVWFQIIAHLVRLRSTSVLILDEPEINLHPEKQNDLVRIIKDYFSGSVIIATHSVELMNNVNVSHIINVQKKQKQPKIKSTKDRMYLDLVRSQIGSSFNLIASQFEECDIIVFTEAASDFFILKKIADLFGIKIEAFNIPVHGFSEYKKAVFYKEAYEKLIGKTVNYTMLLDRDYYPERYLESVKKELEDRGILTLFTIGKEIENIFLWPSLILKIIPDKYHQKLYKFWDKLFKAEHLDCYGSYMTLHQKFLNPRLDIKTITKSYTPAFDDCWNDPKARFNILAGKTGLEKLRQFHRSELKRNLSQTKLIERLVEVDDGTIKNFIEAIFHLRSPYHQVLRYKK